MKKADNFDAKQWLVENKITTQSRLNEEENNTLTQEDFNILKDKGFNAELNTQHDFIWIERQSGLKKADWRYLNNLLVKNLFNILNNIKFKIKLI